MSRSFHAELADRADRAGVRIGDAASRQLESYFEILKRWNNKISLTSLPLEEFPGPTLDRLLIEAAIAAPLLPQGEALVLDIGSGGGSPAIPLKILRPEIVLTMTEARQKKVAFLREAVRTLGLSEVTVLDGRLEGREWPRPRPFDCATVRAVRIDSAMATVIRSAVAPLGRVLLFGSDAPTELGFRQVDRRTLPAGSVLQLVELQD